MDHQVLLKLCKAAVDNVLSGRSADGGRAIDVNISFPRAQTIHHMAAITLAHIVQGVTRDLDADEWTLLTTKLLTHLSRRSDGPLRACHGLNVKAVCVAINNRPGILRGRASMAAMIRAAGQDEATAIRKSAAADIRPRRVIATFGQFQLTEITDPYHLREDGLRIGHCTGSLFNQHYLKSLGPSPTARERLFALAYWQRIASGEFRMFSLLKNGSPVATMAYVNGLRRITEIATIDKVICPNSRFFPPLCKAITALRKTVPVRVIIGLPFPQDENHGFTEDGEYIRITADTVMRILTGVIVATKKHGAYEVQQFCRNPNLTIELAFASSEALKGLTTAQANLRCVGNKLTLEALTRADNDIETISANSIVMPELRTVGGTQSFYDAELVHQPRLERIDGSNYGTRVRKIYQPRVTYVGGINRFICVKEMVQPPLKGKRPCVVEWPPEVYGYPM